VPRRGLTDEGQAADRNDFHFGAACRAWRVRAPQNKLAVDLEMTQAVDGLDGTVARFQIGGLYCRPSSC